MVADMKTGLVEAAWLLENIDRPDLRILDASWHLPTVNRDAGQEYLDGHVPGAVFFDIDAVSDRDHEMPHMLPSPEYFGKTVGAMGIGNDDFVVVYDVLGLFSAARVWWMFRVFGHDRVAILNGGLEAWKQAGGTLKTGRESPKPKPFGSGYRPEMVRSLEDMKANLSSGNETVFDARSSARFKGQAPEPRAGVRGGHIPGSVNLPFDMLLEMDSKKVLPDRKLTSVLEAVLPPDGRPIVCSCGTGVTACVLALGLHLAGRENVAVYDGSWTEWGSQPDTPVESE